MDRFETLIIISLVLVSLYWFLFFTLNSQIYGVDSWYWIKFGFHNILLTNLIGSFMFLFPFLLFSIAPNIHLRDSFFIASLFLINAFSLRFLEVELDDFIMYFISFISILWVKLKFGAYPFSKDWHKILALAIVIGYVFFYWNLDSYFLTFSPANNFLENFKNPINIFFILPALYLLGYNRKWKWFAFIIVYFILLGSGKMLTNPLPILIFAIYLDFLTDKEFRYKRYWVWIFFVMSMMIFITFPLITVNNNNNAFNDYCDVSTRICNNSNETVWYYGHYFSYLGYLSNNSENYGVNCCIGDDCIGNLTFYNR